MAADLDKPSLHHGHRCDRCGSRAYVHVIIEYRALNTTGHHDAGELYFCRHHWNAASPSLKASGQIRHLIDDTRFLTEHIQPPEATELNNLKK